MGRLYAAGIFADFITATISCCDARAFTESTARTAATVHLSATVENSCEFKMSTNTLPRV
jgi:hypothetical protein